MAASGQYGIGAEMALRRQRAINTDSDSDEEEAVVGGSLRATLGVGHAEGAGEQPPHPKTGHRPPSGRTPRYPQVNGLRKYEIRIGPFKSS